MVNSRAKGAAGEREWRDYLRALGCTEARRGQQFAGGPDSPDVVGGFPGTHVEVKRVEALNIENAMRQAEHDAGYNHETGKEAAVPYLSYVAHRRNRTEWLVTVRARNLVEFCRRVLAAQETKA